MINETQMVVAPVPPHPMLRVLASFPIALFSGALATDLAYVATADMMWADFSAWLLAGGMALGVLAAIVGLGDLIANRRARRGRTAAVLVIGSLLVLALGFLNNLVHSRDAWTSVMPEGLVLSAIVVVVMLVTVLLSAAAERRAVIVDYSRVRA